MWLDLWLVIVTILFFAGTVILAIGFERMMGAKR